MSGMYLYERQRAVWLAYILSHCLPFHFLSSQLYRIYSKTILSCLSQFKNHPDFSYLSLIHSVNKYRANLKSILVQWIFNCTEGGSYFQSFCSLNPILISTPTPFLLSWNGFSCKVR